VRGFWVLVLSIKDPVWVYTMCPADNATAGSLGRRRAGQLRFGFVAVLKGYIVYTKTQKVAQIILIKFSHLGGKFLGF
jgi:hypothetical protein